MAVSQFDGTNPLQEWIPQRPYALQDLRDFTVPDDHTLEIKLGYDYVNGEKWDPETPLATIEYDSVYEWVLHQTAKHPFHIHLYHMQVVEPGGCGVHEEGEWYDTIAAPGSCTVRFFTADIGQRCVLHCHVYFHEDNGSMSWVNVTGEGMPTNTVDSPQYQCTVQENTISAGTITPTEVAGTIAPTGVVTETSSSVELVPAGTIAPTEVVTEAASSVESITTGTIVPTDVVTEASTSVESVPAGTIAPTEVVTEAHTSVESVPAGTIVPTEVVTEAHTSVESVLVGTATPTDSPSEEFPSLFVSKRMKMSRAAAYGERSEQQSSSTRKSFSFQFCITFAVSYIILQNKFM